MGSYLCGFVLKGQSYNAHDRKLDVHKELNKSKNNQGPIHGWQQMLRKDRINKFKKKMILFTENTVTPKTMIHRKKN